MESRRPDQGGSGDDRRRQPSRRRRMDRVRPYISAGTRWPRPERIVRIIDVGLKSTALLAALFAAGFLATPDVHLVGKPRIQAFIDVRDMENRYETLGSRTPTYVLETAREYNSINEKDLLQSENSTAELISPSSLCEEDRRVLLIVFPSTDCSESNPQLSDSSRGRYYERLLIQKAALLPEPPPARELKDAFSLLRGGEYVTIRYGVENEGAGYAANVRLATPEQFLASDDQPFALSPHSVYTVRFETARGVLENDPANLQTDLSWENGGGAIGSRAQRVVVIILLILVAWTFLAELLVGEKS